jgi:hypothetical protein
MLGGREGCGACEFVDGVGAEWTPQASLSRGIKIMTGGKASNANGGGRIHVAATDLSEGALLNLAENSGVKEERAGPRTPRPQRRRLLDSSAPRRLTSLFESPEAPWRHERTVAGNAADVPENADGMEHRVVGGSRRRLLHSNMGAYWVKRNLDGALMLSGDGQTGLYEATTRNMMSLKLYGTVLFVLADRRMHLFVASVAGALRSCLTEAGRRGAAQGWRCATWGNWCPRCMARSRCRCPGGT